MKTNEERETEIMVVRKKKSKETNKARRKETNKNLKVYHLIHQCLWRKKKQPQPLIKLISLLIQTGMSLLQTDERRVR